MDIAMKKMTFKLGLILVFMLAGIYACQDELAEKNETLKTEEVNKISSLPVSDGGVTPYTILGDNQGGNRTCGEVATAFNTTFDLTTVKVEANFNTYNWPYGIKVTVSGDDGEYLEFSMDEPYKIDDDCYKIGAVIVKGGTDPTAQGAYRSANIYYYEEGTLGDSGLSTPNEQGISNITFCLIKVDCEDNGDCENWQEETAFGGDEGFNVGARNAWFYVFDGVGEQTIWAGQNIPVGTVEIVDGEIVISLNNNVELVDEVLKKVKGTIVIPHQWIPYYEAVKIQAYDENELPESRPAAGHFTYKGMDLTIPVELAGGPKDYYIIHLDVKICMDDMD
jgi:hypothetical protein